MRKTVIGRLPLKFVTNQLLAAHAPECSDPPPTHQALPKLNHPPYVLHHASLMIQVTFDPCTPSGLTPETKTKKEVRWLIVWCWWLLVAASSAFGPPPRAFLKGKRGLILQSGRCAGLREILNAASREKTP